jgi:hypothetical protein
MENTACRPHVRRVHLRPGLCSEAGLAAAGWIAMPVASFQGLLSHNSITRVSITHTVRNPHAAVKSSFQLSFSVNAQWAGLHYQLTGRFHLRRSPYRMVVPGIPAGGSAPHFLKISNWINEVVFTSNMTEHLLIFSLQSQIHLTILLLGDGLGVGFPTNGQSGIQTSANCIIVLRDDSKVTYNSKVGRRDALLVCTFDVPDPIRKSQRNLQQATRAVHNRAAKWSAAEGGSHENRFKHRSV